MDQVYALNCTVLGSNPRLRPCTVQKYVRDLLKYARDFIFDPFLRFFLFDSLGAVPENPGTVIRGVRLSVGPIYGGTTVVISQQPTLFRLPFIALTVVLVIGWLVATSMLPIAEYTLPTDGCCLLSAFYNLMSGVTWLRACRPLHTHGSEVVVNTHPSCSLTRDCTEVGPAEVPCRTRAWFWCLLGRDRKRLRHFPDSRLKTRRAGRLLLRVPSVFARVLGLSTFVIAIKSAHFVSFRFFCTGCTLY